MLARTTARLSLVCLTLLLSAPARADQDYLQRWMQLYQDYTFRVHDKGSWGYKGLEAVRAFGPYRAVPYIADAMRKLGKTNFGDSGRGARTLRELEDPRAIPVLLAEGLRDEPAETPEALGRLKAAAAIPALVQMLDNSDHNLRSKALVGLTLLGSKDAVPGVVAAGERVLPLVTSVGAGHGAFLHDLMHSLGWLGDSRAVPFLRRVLAYKFPYKADKHRTHHKAAALALAMLGDRASASAIAALPKEMEAAMFLGLPVALQRAKEVLLDPDLGEEVMDYEVMRRMEAGGARVLTALRVFSHLGSAADLPFLQKQRAVMRKLRDDVITGDDPPAGFGVYVVENRTMPLLFDWAMASLGDTAAAGRLVKALSEEDKVVVSEAARSLVLLGRQEHYPAVGRRLRELFGRREFDCKWLVRGAKDRGLHARKTMARLLGEQGTLAALRLLAETHNDCNVNVVFDSRRAIRRYPRAAAFAELVRVYQQAGEWELWQLATMMELLGEQGLKLLHRLARTSASPAQQAVAMQAVIRAEFGHYKPMICQASKQGSKEHKELVRWIEDRFKYHAPGILTQSCSAGPAPSAAPEAGLEVSSSFFAGVATGAPEGPYRGVLPASRLRIEPTPTVPAAQPEPDPGPAARTSGPKPGPVAQPAAPPDIPSIADAAAAVASPQAPLAGAKTAPEPRAVYRARIGKQDHKTSKGKDLRSAAAIVTQDRANYHRFNNRDEEDGEDPLFKAPAKRAWLTRALRRALDTATARSIATGCPLIEVRVWDDRAQVVILEE